jgi:integrase
MPQPDQPRRLRGAGTVYQRTDGREGFIARLTISGRPVRRVFANRELALAWLESQQPLEQRLARAGDGTLGAWLREWLINPGTRRYRRRSAHRASTASARKGQLVSDKTGATYRSLVENHWLKHPIAQKPLGGVTTRDVERVLDEWDDAAQVSKTTIGHLRRILSAAYTAAAERELVAANPVGATGFRSGDPNRVLTLRLNEDLARRITEATKGTPVWAVVVLMVNTGLRLGEALALDWDDVRITAKDRTGKTVPGFVTVRSALLESKENGKQHWFLGEPKTVLSQRTVWFDADVVPVLMKTYREAGRPKRGLVFPRPGKPEEPDNPQRVSKLFSAILASREIELRRVDPDRAPRSQITIRDLRSLHASIQVHRGEPISVVSRRLGHSDPATTLRRYISVPTEADLDLARRSGLYGRTRAPKDPASDGPGDERDGQG